MTRPWTVADDSGCSGLGLECFSPVRKSGMGWSCTALYSRLSSNTAVVTEEVPVWNWTLNHYAVYLHVHKPVFVYTSSFCAITYKAMDASGCLGLAAVAPYNAAEESGLLESSDYSFSLLICCLLLFCYQRNIKRLLLLLKPGL